MENSLEFDRSEKKRERERKRYNSKIKVRSEQYNTLLNCGVCGSGKQVGKYTHFGGICCNSCRSFFRREVLTKREAACITGGNDCTISEITRSNCKGCRFNRCVDNGMKPFLVNYDLKVQPAMNSSGVVLEAENKVQHENKLKENIFESTNSFQRYRSEDDLTPCAICGSVEVAHKNYGVDSCISCKNFYLRNVSRESEFTCVSGLGDCVITKVNRTNCKSCRLKRCLAAGFGQNCKKGRQKTQKKNKMFCDENKLEWEMEVDGWMINELEPENSKPSKQNKKSEAKTDTTDVVTPEPQIVIKCEPVELDGGNLITQNPNHHHLHIKHEPDDDTELESHDHESVEYEPDEIDIVEYEPNIREIVKYELNETEMVKCETDESEVVTERDPLESTSCHVCQAEAPGQLFYGGGLCCYSCRAFFRREVDSTLVCSRGDNCVITKQTRTGCRSCRFNRCLEAGMKIEFVIKRKKINEEEKFCDYCTSSFSNSSNLMKHKKKKHSEIGESSSNGLIKTAKEKDDELELDPKLMKHNIKSEAGTDTSNVGIPEPPLIIQCEPKTEKKKHSDIRNSPSKKFIKTAKENLKCNHCKAMFTHSHSLLRHKEERNEKVCSSCSMVFCNGRALRSHLNKFYFASANCAEYLGP